MIFHMAANGNRDGYAITAQNYFSEIDKSGEAPSKQAFSDARKKLSFEAFKFLLEEANHEDLIEQKWHGHTVRIVDGSKLHLPNTAEIREHFTIPNTSGGPGHYPQAWMVTAINSFSGQPAAVELGCHKSSERELMLRLFPYFKSGDLLLLDRGLGGAQVYLEHERRDLYFIHRAKTGGKSAPWYIKGFLKSRKASWVVSIEAEDHDGEKIAILVRLVRGPKDSEGKRIVFVTNLLNEKIYSVQSIRDLYKNRWAVETMYGRVKNILHLEKFHAKSVNGILQEIYANLLVISLTALIEYQASRRKNLDRSKVVPNFKAAVQVVRRHLYRIAGPEPVPADQALAIAEKMVEEAGRVLWKKQPGRSYPRVSKQPINSWNLCKNKKLKKAKMRGKCA